MNKTSKYIIFVIFVFVIATMLIPKIASASTVIASNTIQYQDNTPITTYSTGYTIAKQITMLQSYSGSMRICFDLAGGWDEPGDVITTGYARIYLNGVAYGAEKSKYDTPYQTFCDDYANLNLQAGNDIQVYYHGEMGEETSIANFKIKFDITGGPTPTPTPIPLGLVSDTFTSVQHSISLCRPYPVEYYDFNTVPATHSCNDTQIFYLDQYPLNSLPSGGQSHRISDGEMLFVYASVNDYPGTGYINTSYYNKDTNTLLFSFNQDLPACAGDCNWAYWSWFVYSYIGHFGWEINSTGYYNVSVKTPWGEHVYNFKVEATNPNNQIDTIFNSTPINAFVRVDGDPVGNTPINALIAEGMHNISFEKSGYNTFTDEYFISSTGHIINVTLTPYIPNPEPRQVSIVRLEGNGSISTLRNNAFNGVLTESESIKTFQYNTSDSYSFFAVPTDGYEFIKYCLVSGCTDSIYSNPYTGTIINNFTLYAFFNPLSNLRNVKMEFNEVGHGSVSVYVNNIFVGANSLNMTVYLNKSDSIKFMPNPSTGYIFDHCTMTGYTCTGGATFSNIQNNSTYRIYWALTDDLCNGNPCDNGSTPSPTNSPGAPFTNPFATEDTINKLGELENLLGLFSFVPAMIGLIISVILIGGAYIWGKNKGGSDVGMIASVITALICFAVGLLKWYIFLIMIVIVIVVAIAYMQRDDRI